MDVLANLQLSERTGSVRLSVRVKPRASRRGVVGLAEGALELAVTEPPVEGMANEAVCALLAEVLGVRRRSVTVVAGSTGRAKVVEIDGLDAASARERIAAAIAGGQRR